MGFRPYSVRCPQFEVTSGGIRVLYGLYGALLLKGQVAFLNAKFDNPDFVGIYPEIYWGNDMGAKTVVRYILQTPGVMGTFTNGIFRAGPTSFPSEDKIFVFSKLYDTFGVDDDHILFLPILNLHIFKNKKKKNRKKTCFLVGKGINKNKHPKDAIELTREFSQDQMALADLLNECHTLYGYDRMSAQYEIARLCGCRVKYYGDFSKEELKLYEPGMNGFSYGDEEDVPLRADEFEAHYRDLIKIFDKKLDRFIDLTQE